MDIMTVKNSTPRKRSPKMTRKLFDNRQKRLQLLFEETCTLAQSIDEVVIVGDVRFDPFDRTPLNTDRWYDSDC